VLVIDENGQKVGVMLTRDAIKLAEEKELDLVEVSPNADPPVAKIMDYGKFMYQRQKLEKESKKKSASQKPPKEVKIRVKTDEHDLQTKIRHIRRFLEHNHKAKVIIIYRGREMVHPELGKELLQRVIDEVSDLGQPEFIPKQEGYNLVTIIAPYSEEQKRKIQRQKEAQKAMEQTKDKEEIGG